MSLSTWISINVVELTAAAQDRQRWKALPLKSETYTKLEEDEEIEEEECAPNPNPHTLIRRCLASVCVYVCVYYPNIYVDHP